MQLKAVLPDFPGVILLKYQGSTAKIHFAHTLWYHTADVHRVGGAAWELRLLDGDTGEFLTISPLQFYF